MYGIGQTKDVGSAAARRLHLPRRGDDVPFVDQLLNEFRDGRHADMQLFASSESVHSPADGHVGDDTSLDDAVLVYDALSLFLVEIEKFGKRCHFVERF